MWEVWKGGIYLFSASLIFIHAASLLGVVTFAPRKGEYTEKTRKRLIERGTPRKR